MQPADLQLQSDEPLMLLSFPQASKQRRSASVVAHLLLLHGEAEEIKGEILLYLRQAKHQLHYYSSAAWGDKCNIREFARASLDR